MMKKGCFIKLIIILTILVAAVLYIVKNHFDDFIVTPGKGMLKSLASKEIGEKFQDIKNTPEKDSLKILINEYVQNKINNINFSDDSDTASNDFNLNFKFSESEKSEVNAEINLIVDSLDSFLKDNLIDRDEFLRIKEILKENADE